MITLDEVMSIARPYFEAQKRGNERLRIFETFEDITPVMKDSYLFRAWKILSGSTDYGEFDRWQRQVLP